MIQLFAALIPTLFAVTVVHSHLLNSTPDASKLLLQSNARWAENTTRSNPTFFTNSAGGQTPKVCPTCCETHSFVFFLTTHPQKSNSDPLDWVLGLPCSGVRHYWLASWGYFRTAKYCKVRHDQHLPKDFSRHDIWPNHRMTFTVKYLVKMQMRCPSWSMPSNTSW